MLAAYFENETHALTDVSWDKIHSWHDWTSRREEYRRQLLEMLGLDPLPERTPLEAVVTGKLERDDFTIEKLYFQSRPQLYVTGNLYLPKNAKGPAPAILYVCGHSTIKKDGINYGAKAHYQHHGAWFARNGYVCLVIDTLQLGEIEGVHHGTNREGMWWWNARGYSPAGVEAWNSIRAIDYLVSRPEVDANRIGVTGRSGGGAYSWYLTALDHRVKAAVPVAGITTLKNHVIDGCVEGHCDCMYFVNTYRWDYTRLAGLAAPRPLLISNTDRDKLFPFDGVISTYQKVRRLYELNDKGPDVALQMAAGTHEDSQILQLCALQWFNHHLKDEDLVIESAAKPYFKPEELKVLDRLPADQINTQIHDTFVPLAQAPEVPHSLAKWEAQRNEWMRVLREKCFRGWPGDPKAPIESPWGRRVFHSQYGNVQFSAYDFSYGSPIELRVYLLFPAQMSLDKLTSIELELLDEIGWREFVGAMTPEFAAALTAERAVAPDALAPSQLPQRRVSGTNGLAFVAPRGFGLTAWSQDPKEQTHIRRRYMLLGQTLDGMRVLDVSLTIGMLRNLPGLSDVPISLTARRDLAGIALYAALFRPNIESVDVHDLPKSHRDGPDFLNVLRFLDLPQTVAMVAEKSHVVIHEKHDDGWEYPLAVAKKLNWTKRVEIRTTSIDANAPATAGSK
jgi:dienelactone hydrolase